MFNLTTLPPTTFNEVTTQARKIRHKLMLKPNIALRHQMLSQLNLALRHQMLLQPN